MYLNAEDVLLTTLREITDLRTPPRLGQHWIMYSRPEEDSIYPFISIRNISSTTISLGHGQSDVVLYKTQTDTFTSTGQYTFTLTQSGLLQVHSVTLTPDLDPPQTYPDYYTYNTEQNTVTFRNLVPNGTVVSINYSYNTQESEMKGRYVTHTYEVVVWVKRNTSNVNDELFIIDGVKYANTKLVNYLARLVIDKIIQRYREMRARGWKVYVGNPSEIVYDPTTRLYAKIIPIIMEGVEVVEIEENDIQDVQSTVTV